MLTGAKEFHVGHQIAISESSEVDEMLWLAVTVFLLLWLLGVATSTVEGVVLHLLLVAALGMMLVGIVQGRKAI